MPEPKYVIAMGACGRFSGGLLQAKGYNVLKGIDRFIPVDVHIPGCPPRPEALLHAFMTLQEKIDQQQLTGAPTARAICMPTSPANSRCRNLANTICNRRIIPRCGRRRCFRDKADIFNVLTLETIKGQIEQAIPGAKLEIVKNDAPSAQHSLLVDNGSAFAVAKFLRDEPFAVRFDYAPRT